MSFGVEKMSINTHYITGQINGHCEKNDNSLIYNENLHNSGWLTLKELMDILDVSYDSIIKYIKRGKFTKIKQIKADIRSNGGKIWMVHITDPAIPISAQIKFLENNSPSAPVPDMSVTPPADFGNGGFLNIDIPEKAKKSALAAYRLLILWRSFRSTQKKKTKADEIFINMYKGGIIASDVREVLGDVSIKSLYRWNAYVGDKDWRRLIDEYYLPKHQRLNEQEEKVFKYFLLHENKLSVSQAIKQTRLSLLAMGIRCDKSDMTFRRWAKEFEEKNKALFVTLREGEKARKDMLDPYIIRDASLLEVGDCFVLDGHKLNLMIKSPDTGKPVRAVLIGVLDWKSWDLMGYEVMLTENTMSVASAYRHSVLYLGHPSRVVYIDNGKAFKARFFTKNANLEEMIGLYHRLGVEVVTAKPYNARAKVIENWFGILNGQFERLLPSYSGSSIGDKPARYMRNEKLAAWVHRVLTGDYVPTLFEFIEIFEQWLWWYREINECPNNKGYTIRQTVERYKQSEKYIKRCQGFDKSALDDLMMERKDVMVYRNGIKLFGEYYYHSALAGLSGQRTKVKYSILQRDHVKVLHPFERIWLPAERVESVHPIARIFGEEREKEVLEREIKRITQPSKVVRNEVKEVMNELCDTKREIDNAMRNYIVDKFQNMVWQRKSKKLMNDEVNVSIDISKLLPSEGEEKKLDIKLFESDLY